MKNEFVHETNDTGGNRGVHALFVRV